MANGATAAWRACQRIAEEDAKRPNRERECLVKERTRLVNRMKGTLARLGIRNFRLTLRNAAEHLAALSTPEGSPLPPNVAAELERDIARLRLVIGQIKHDANPLHLGGSHRIFAFDLPCDGTDSEKGRGVCEGAGGTAKDGRGSAL